MAFEGDLGGNWTATNRLGPHDFDVENKIKPKWKATYLEDNLTKETQCN